MRVAIKTRGGPQGNLVNYIDFAVLVIAAYLATVLIDLSLGRKNE